MTYIFLLLFSGCQSDFSFIKPKGRIDDFMKSRKNYIKDGTMVLDQSKIRGMVESFVDKPEELSDPFETSFFGGFSFIHFVFAMECEKNDTLFENAYAKLFEDKPDVLERAFRVSTRNRLNLVHLALKYGNQSGFEKIKSLPISEKYFKSSNIIGEDPFMLAVRIISRQVAKPDYCQNYINFLVESISYMSSKSYFLDSEGNLIKKSKGKDSLTGSISAFVDSYEDEDDVERFIPIFRFILGNVMSKLGKSKVLEALDNWEEVSGAKNHNFLQQRIGEVIEQVKKCSEDDLSEMVNDMLISQSGKEQELSNDTQDEDCDTTGKEDKATSSKTKKSDNVEERLTALERKLDAFIDASTRILASKTSREDIDLQIELLEANKSELHAEMDVLYAERNNIVRGREKMGELFYRRSEPSYHKLLKANREELHAKIRVLNAKMEMLESEKERLEEKDSHERRLSTEKQGHVDFEKVPSSALTTSH